MARFGPFAVDLAAGVGQNRFHGDAYGAPTRQQPYALESNNVVGASVGTALQLRISRFRLRLGLDDAIYRVKAYGNFLTDTTSTPTQHDLTVSLGVGLALGRPTP